jgi:hypothetical protein
MELDATIRGVVDPLEHLDHRSDVDAERRFFEDLTPQSRFERLAQLDDASRQAPLALERFVRPLHQQHPIVVQDDGADAHDWPGRINPRHDTPMTLTTTRFRR